MNTSEVETALAHAVSFHDDGGRRFLLQVGFDANFAVQLARLVGLVLDRHHLYWRRIGGQLRVDSFAQAFDADDFERLARLDDYLARDDLAKLNITQSQGPRLDG